MWTHKSINFACIWICTIIIIIIIILKDVFKKFLKNYKN